MGCKDAQEHAQWIDRGVTYGRSFTCTNAVGIGQCGWVGVGTRNHSHDSKVVELIAQTGNRSHNEDWNDGDEEARVYIFQAVSLYNGFPETCPRLNTYRGKKKHKPDFTKHHVGRGCGVGDKFEPITEPANQDCNNQRATGDTEFQRNRHAWDCDWDASEKNADDNANKNRADIGCIKALGTVAHHFGHAVHIILRAYYHNTVANLEMVITAGKEVHALAGNARYIDAIDT